MQDRPGFWRVDFVCTFGRTCVQMRKLLGHFIDRDYDLCLHTAFCSSGSHSKGFVGLAHCEVTFWFVLWIFKVDRCAPSTIKITLSNLKHNNYSFKRVPVLYFQSGNANSCHQCQVRNFTTVVIALAICSILKGTVRWPKTKHAFHLILLFNLGAL